MPNDIVPQPSLAEQIIERINLPEIIGGAAGKAISRLIGEITDVPSVWIQRYTQSVKDGTEARSAVSRALASEVAKSTAADTGLVERAAEVMLAKEVRKQANKEAIARKTLEHLSDEDIKNAKIEVDSDWMNIFSQHAENASSERLQEIWGRVLAGEIRKPSSFSLKTLRFVAELDQEIAKLFEEHVDLILAGDFIIRDDNTKGPPFSALLSLQDFGLIIGVGQNLTKTFTFPSDQLIITHQKKFLFLEGKVGAQLKFSAYILTRVGAEIASILNPPFNLERAKAVVDLIPKNGLTEITLRMPVSGTGLHSIQMWKKDEPVAAPATSNSNGAPPSP